MFGEREPHYPLAREYFLEKQAPYQGHEALKNDLWLAKPSSRSITLPHKVSSCWSLTLIRF
jgi:hypothetical protein